MNRITDYFKGIFTLALVVQVSYMSGQVENDECIYAHVIPDVTMYCSDIFEFSNIDATPSVQANPSCWPQNTITHDVWFSFVPKNRGIVLNLTGATVTNEGTLELPSLALYSGTCNSLVEEACNSVQLGDNSIEITQTDIVIGRRYYIRVDGRNENEGFFTLCINTFAPIKDPESDCDEAVILCNKDPFFVEKIDGAGDNTNEISTSLCIREESASVWYKWTCKDPGSLTFTISPNNKPDDIDFALFELPGGIDDCGNKRAIRCMASGETIGNPGFLNSPCFGPTGMSLTDNDTQEDPGCQSGNNNFVRYIDMEAGKSYALIINNFSQSGAGFGIEWGGTGTFLGPEADFIADAREAFECDKTINFYNNSEYGPDSIIAHTWFFGEGSTPNSSGLVDSLAVSYNSFGNKTVALTLESRRGCIVTKTVDFFINPCCRDTTNLDVSGLATDLICPDEPSGTIEGFGNAGNPEYEYSIDGDSYKPNPRFFNLDVGTYILYIRDSKGCVDSTEIVIAEPMPIIVDAGTDQLVDLGCATTINGQVIIDRNFTSIWQGSGFLDTLEKTNLNAEVMPPGASTYTLTVTDENGCTASDQVFLDVNIVRPVIFPNAIRPGSPTNGIFTIFGGKAVKGIDELLVFDRWGSLMYKGEKLPINDVSIGWAGMFNGEPVNPGVYVWSAAVRFVDEVVIRYAGDVTVFR